MTEYAAKKAKELRIPTTGTPEELACGRFAYQSTVTAYGNFTIAASYIYRPLAREKRGYFWAAYRNGGNIEEPASLEAVSPDYFEDDGHALAAAFNWAAQWE